MNRKYNITKKLSIELKLFPKNMVLNPPLKFKYCKEVTICEDDDENNDNNGSITGVDNEDEEKYETTVEDI